MNSNITYICSYGVVHTPLLNSSKQESKHLLYLVPKISVTTSVFSYAVIEMSLPPAAVQEFRHFSLSHVCKNSGITNVCSSEQFLTAETNFSPVIFIRSYQVLTSIFASTPFHTRTNNEICVSTFSIPL
jgi:hypothetical protein